ncbi:Uncharacterized protein Fot_40105 [Forsythia ovata]|uniref:Uncharacterized protein n=1 Tax=Forsythia ovata TaxID=205694 RepID=A0ABD1S7F0_9LAMI
MGTFTVCKEAFQPPCAADRRVADLLLLSFTRSGSLTGVTPTCTSCRLQVCLKHLASTHALRRLALASSELCGFGVWSLGDPPGLAHPKLQGCRLSAQALAVA